MSAPLFMKRKSTRLLIYLEVFFFSSDGVKHIFQLRQPAARSLTRPLYYIHIRSPVKQCKETWPVWVIAALRWINAGELLNPTHFFSILKEFLFSLPAHPSSLLRLTQRLFITDASVAGKKHKCGKQNFFANLKCEGFRRWEVAHAAEKQIHFWGRRIPMRLNRLTLRFCVK